MLNPSMPADIAHERALMMATLSVLCMQTTISPIQTVLTSFELRLRVLRLILLLLLFFLLLFLGIISALVGTILAAFTSLLRLALVLALLAFLGLLFLIYCAEMSAVAPHHTQCTTARRVSQPMHSRNV